MPCKFVSSLTQLSYTGKMNEIYKFIMPVEMPVFISLSIPSVASSGWVAMFDWILVPLWNDFEQNRNKKLCIAISYGNENKYKKTYTRNRVHLHFVLGDGARLMIKLKKHTILWGHKIPQIPSNVIHNRWPRIVEMRSFFGFNDQ